MEQKLDEIDRQILKILENDAKTSIAAMSDILNITKTPIYERIKRLENEGFIVKYTAVLNTAKIATSITVYCFVSLDAQKGANMDAFQDQIQKYNEIVECAVVGGEFDFLLKVIVKDLDAYYKFTKNELASLTNVGLVKSAFVLNESKATNAFPLL